MSILKSLISPVSKLLDKVIPDADERQKAKVRLAELSNQSDEVFVELVAAANQSMHELNVIDAKSEDKFRTRWRPALGWICVVGLGWEFILRQFIVTAMVIAGHSKTLIPSLDLPAILGLTTTLLGMGMLRTVEKVKGLR